MPESSHGHSELSSCTKLDSSRPWRSIVGPTLRLQAGNRHGRAAGRRKIPCIRISSGSPFWSGDKHFFRRGIPSRVSFSYSVREAYAWRVITQPRQPQDMIWKGAGYAFACVSASPMPVALGMMGHEDDCDDQSHGESDKTKLMAAARRRARTTPRLTHRGRPRGIIGGERRRIKSFAISVFSQM